MVPAAPSVTATQAAPAAVEVRLDFEEGPDPDFGEEATSVRGFLSIPALGVRKKLFAVPTPYRCERAEADASADVSVRCLGDDGWGGALVRVEGGRVHVEPHDYGRIPLRDASFDLALPAGVVPTFFAPARYPSTVR